MPRKINLSVRSLVEITCRRGDLDLTYFISAKRAQIGSQIHRMIQKEKPEEYQAEVSVSHTMETDHTHLEISGRIDGVFVDSDGITVIEEIKSTTTPLNIPNFQPHFLHMAQAKVYAYIYGLQNRLEKIKILMTYCHVDSKKRKEIESTHTFVELEKFFTGLTSKFLGWMKTQSEMLIRRNSSAKELTFPFSDYRKGQKNFAGQVYRSIRDKKHLLALAPTGIGKTMATLFPAIKAIGENKTDRIFFLSARSTGKEIAEKTVTVLRGNGVHVKSLTLTAKEKTCFNTDLACTGKECSYAQGYFDKLEKAMTYAVTLDNYSRSFIEETAHKFHICPFEFSLELSALADIIICDYNYVFDPRAQLRRFFDPESDMSKERFTLLVDEAHNLVSRARDMYSAELSKALILDARKDIKEISPSLYKKIGKLNNEFLAHRKTLGEQTGTFTSKELSKSLKKEVKACFSKLEEWFITMEKKDIPDTLLELYYACFGFSRTAEYFDHRCIVITRRFKREMVIKIFCLDPSERIKEILKSTRNAVFFSATLSPFEFYKRMFGLEEKTQTVMLPSPFPQDNFLLLSKSIDTRYKNRTLTAESIADAIDQYLSHQQGNHMIFFPSYQYMEMIHEKLIQRQQNHYEISLQERSLTEDERTEFLDLFHTNRQKTFAAFVVMGGVFGEAIDLVGEKLSGAVIIGVGLPTISTENELIKEYFDENREDGFTFSYRYPGITRVLQAAGRVIRTEKDKGVVLLIDSRFSHHQYSRLFPDHWRRRIIVSKHTLLPELQNFWK